MTELANYFNPIVGGLFVGTASLLMLWIGGRIAGISGILWNSCAALWGKQCSWQLFFVVGLVLGPLLVHAFTSLPKPPAPQASFFILALGGALVGIGTKMGGGCTSGHGICGISRLSPRSIVATTTFMITAILTATLHHLISNAG